MLKTVREHQVSHRKAAPHKQALIAFKKPVQTKVASQVNLIHNVMRALGTVEQIRRAAQDAVNRNNHEQYYRT